jgi:hypothetical protein
LKFTVPNKGGTKDWSIRLHLTGSTPASSTAWDNLVNDIWFSGTHGLNLGLSDEVSFIEAIGYADDTSPHVYDHAYSGSVGSLASTAGVQSAYLAALAYWNTDARTSNGHPIYCRNFLHGVLLDAENAGAGVLAAQRTALAAWANKGSDSGGGWTDGTNLHKRCAPGGAVGLTGACRQYPSHRVLARRG